MGRAQAQGENTHKTKPTKHGSMWPDNPYAPENREEDQHAYPSGQFGVKPPRPASAGADNAEHGDDEYYDEE
jgi:hypothetical protein